MVSQIENWTSADRFAVLKSIAPTEENVLAEAEDKNKQIMNLITESRTFKLKISETSNSYFVLNPKDNEIIS